MRMFLIALLMLSCLAKRGKIDSLSDPKCQSFIILAGSLLEAETNNHRTSNSHVDMFDQSEICPPFKNTESFSIYWQNFLSDIKSIDQTFTEKLHEYFASLLTDCNENIDIAALSFVVFTLVINNQISSIREFLNHFLSILNDKDFLLFLAYNMKMWLQKSDADMGTFIDSFTEIESTKIQEEFILAYEFVINPPTSTQSSKNWKDTGRETLAKYMGASQQVLSLLTLYYAGESQYEKLSEKVYNLLADVVSNLKHKGAKLIDSISPSNNRGETIDLKSSGLFASSSTDRVQEEIYCRYAKMADETIDSLETKVSKWLNYSPNFHRKDSLEAKPSVKIPDRNEYFIPRENNLSKPIKNPFGPERII